LAVEEERGVAPVGARGGADVERGDPELAVLVAVVLRREHVAVRPMAREDDPEETADGFGKDRRCEAQLWIARGQVRLVSRVAIERVEAVRRVRREIDG